MSEVTNRPALQLKALLDDDSAPEDNSIISYIDVGVLTVCLFALMVVWSQPQKLIGEASVDSTAVGQRSVSAIPDAIVMDATSAEVNGISSNVGMLDGAIDNQEERLNESEALARLSGYEIWLQGVREMLALSDLSPHVRLRAEENFAALDVSSRVLFEVDEANLTRPGELILLQLLATLQSAKGAIFVEGHTDDELPETYYTSNWELAFDRATAVLQFFVDQGVEMKRLQALSLADSKPLYANDSDHYRALNQRVTLKINRF